MLVAIETEEGKLGQGGKKVVVTWIFRTPAVLLLLCSGCSCLVLIFPGCLIM